MNKLHFFIVVLGALFLLSEISQATITIRNEFGAARFDCCAGSFTLYTKDEVDQILASQARQFQPQIDQANARLTQLEAKIPQDQQKFKTDLQADLENKVGQILTPNLLEQIKQTVTDDATNRVLAKLRAQGVCVTC
jgi:hypothetical protein